MSGSYKKGLESRQRICDAACELAEKYGYDNISVRDICKAAGVTTGSFYHHFKAKTDLMSAICRGGAGHFIPVIRTTLVGKTTAGQLDTFAYYYAKLNDYTGLEQLRVMYRPENHWFQKKREMESLLESIVLSGQQNGDLAAGLPAAEIAAYLYSVLRSCCLNWCMYDCGYDLSAQTIRYMRYAYRPFYRGPLPPLEEVFRDAPDGVR